MLFERRFDNRTGGLVCGPAVLVAPSSLIVPLAHDRRGRLIQHDAKPLSSAWRPYSKHYKVVVRSRESGEEIWVRPYVSELEAFLIYARLIGFDLERMPERFRLPSVWPDGELEYVFATVETFNSTPAGSVWNTPGGVVATDYLALAGGGGGGAEAGGGGGAGGYRTALNFAVAGTLALIVGLGGTGSDWVNGIGGPNYAANGADSKFSSITSTGGGCGGSAFGAGANGGSGAGAGQWANGDATVSGTGIAGQGFNGGTSANRAGAGGGGASANASVKNGGTGASSSITGTAVTRGGGGGAGTASNAGGGTAGTGGAGGGTAGQGSTTNAANCAANTGSGGGGGGSVSGNPGGPGSGGSQGGDGGSGVVILSYTVTLLPSPVFLSSYRQRRT